MLYTIAPIIFRPPSSEASLKVVQKGLRWWSVRPTRSHAEIIVSFMSAYAQDYLNPAWQPGQVLHFGDSSC